MNAYELISEIYRLLGALDKETLQETDNMSLAPEVRTILRAMRESKYLTSNRDQDVASERVEDDRATQDARKNASDGVVGDAAFGVLDRRATSIAQMAAILRRSGLVVQPRHKEGRKDFLMKARRKFAELPRDKRRQIAQAIETLANRDENAGWFDVIHSGNR